MTAEQLAKPCDITTYLRCKTHMEYAAEGADRCLRAQAFDIGLAAGRLEAGNGLLRKALVGLVGDDGREQLEAMEVVMRTLAATDADKAVSINAIHALLATLPESAEAIRKEIT